MPTFNIVNYDQWFNNRGAWGNAKRLIDVVIVNHKNIFLDLGNSNELISIHD